MEDVSTNILIRRYSAIGRIFGVMTVFVGLAVLIGYFLENTVLKSVFPGIVAMNPSTAFAFLFGGISLALLASHKRYTRVGVVFAALTFALGAGKLLSLLSGLDFYLDHILFPVQLDDMVTGFQNRMAPNTALNFSLTGLALLFLHLNRRERLAHILALSGFFIALLTFLGYLFGVSYFIGIARFIPMALNTATAFLLLSLGILFATGDRGFMQTVFSTDSGGFIARRLLPAAILVPAAFGSLFNNGRVTGIYTVELAISLLVLANIVLFTALVWRLVAEVDRKDRARKEAAGKLREEKHFAETLLASIGDGVIAIDRSWKIFLWNQASETLSGYTEKDALGRQFGDVVHFLREHDRKANTAFISDAMHSGKVKFMENHTVMVRKDGTEVPVSDSAAPILDEKGDVQGAIIVYRDASQEKEDKLLRSSYAYASHQLRTPVTQALWSLEVALSEREADKCLAGVRIAHTAMKSVQKLISELVEVSEVDQKTVIPTFTQVNLKTLLEKRKQALQDVMSAKLLTLVVEIDPSVSTIFSDEKILDRILQELLENAVTYCKDRSTVKVIARPDERGVLIEVADQGIGIAEEQKSLVFTKFFRGKNIDPESAGAGLGLYLAQEYAKLLRGKIWFKSREGEGTTFYLLLEKKNS